MSTIFILFMVLIMIACVMLVIIVMAQNPKGGGLSATFGGASSAQFGVQRTNDFMEKATWVLGSVIVGLIILSVVMTANPVQRVQSAPVKQNTTAPVQAPTTTPQAPVAPAPVPAQ